ncbi:DNA-processing protein DprA [Isoptericola aurantiacus]|uniref:DNA-processing protein DprA n=1 Tax=Isoptericola aurantiacus TaxID=3377839 RepID=UPI00383A315D
MRFDVDDPWLAAAAWSRLAEPGDVVAGSLVAHLGAAGALAWLVEAAADPVATLRAPVLDGLDVPPSASPSASAAPSRAATGEPRHRNAALRLLDAVGRWVPRLDSLDPRRELRVLERLGGALLVPGDPDWPGQLDALGAAAPFALWVRGRADVADWARGSVAVVGARAATAYGERVAEDLAAGLADQGFTVVSGGAYGIDAAAHRGALAAGGRSAAVLAGGVDRYYPQGNDGLLRRLVEHDGAVVAEVPPGSAPFRQRFLARNRVIAALTSSTVVVEAARRSGALSTARRAVELLRPVGAVPGPVTSMASTGCHGLLRDGVAVCITSAADAVELAGPVGSSVQGPEETALVDPVDALGPDERLLLDALPVRQSATVDSLVRSAGLPARRVVTLLGALERCGLARRDGARWRRAPS